MHFEQAIKLFAPDSIDFLVAQSDGNLVLYNVALYHVYGRTRPSAVWASGTYGAANGPFTLVMQPEGATAVACTPAYAQCLSRPFFSVLCLVLAR